jgi:hypothetical protein
MTLLIDEIEEKTITEPKKNKNEESYATFNKWFSSFNKVFNGFRPQNIKKLVDDCNNNHLGIREKLGGINSLIEINLQDSQIPLDDNIARYHYTNIISNFCGKSKTEFEKLFNIEDFKLPNKPNEPKISKKILQFAEKNIGSLYNATQSIIYINGYLAQVGTAWNENCVKTSTHNILVSTSLKAFSLLGHLNIDNRSCFAQNGGNASNKYRLASKENTFVIVGYEAKPKFLLRKNDKNIKFRMWGVIGKHDNEPIISFTNKYGKITYAETVCICKNIASNVLELAEEDISYRKNIFSTGNCDIYFNGDGMTFGHKDVIKNCDRHSI